MLAGAYRDHTGSCLPYSAPAKPYFIISKVGDTPTSQNSQNKGKLSAEPNELETEKCGMPTTGTGLCQGQDDQIGSQPPGAYNKTQE